MGATLMLVKVGSNFQPLFHPMRKPLLLDDFANAIVMTAAVQYSRNAGLPRAHMAELLKAKPRFMHCGGVRGGKKLLVR